MSVPAVRAGLWSLPVYGALLGLSVESAVERRTGRTGRPAPVEG